ncbi:hypothetical protein ACN6MT_11285 [Neobacillus niacini]|uniref:hypothetical protein n=1 Tax=Neobacillus niacini TaxID=86668 RepID=UPI003B023666
MKAKEIIDLLETGDYLLEHFVDDYNSEVAIVGHISKKGENGLPLGGMDRYEFALRDKNEQEVFYNGYTSYLKSKIG